MVVQLHVCVVDSNGLWYEPMLATCPNKNKRLPMCCNHVLISYPLQWSVPLLRKTSQTSRSWALPQSTMRFTSLSGTLGRSTSSWRYVQRIAGVGIRDLQVQYIKTCCLFKGYKRNHQLKQVGLFGCYSCYNFLRSCKLVDLGLSNRKIISTAMERSWMNQLGKNDSAWWVQNKWWRCPSHNDTPLSLITGFFYPIMACSEKNMQNWSCVKPNNMKIVI